MKWGATRMLARDMIAEILYDSRDMNMRICIKGRTSDPSHRRPPPQPAAHRRSLAGGLAARCALRAAGRSRLLASTARDRRTGLRSSAPGAARSPLPPRRSASRATHYSTDSQQDEDRSAGTPTCVNRARALPRLHGVAFSGFMAATVHGLLSVFYQSLRRAFRVLFAEHTCSSRAGMRVSRGARVAGVSLTCAHVFGCPLRCACAPCSSLVAYGQQDSADG